MKRKINIILILLVIFLVPILYYSVQVSTKAVFPNIDKIEKIYVAAHIENGNVNISTIEITDVEQLKQFRKIIDSVSYTRAMGNKNIRNSGDTLMLYIFIKGKGNYDIDVNDNGYILSNNKKYKIKEQETLLYNRLTDLFEK